MSQEAAEALLVLIPRELKPNNLKGFRPLSLCNTSYKMVSKVIVDRLKEAVKGLISPYQASFVLGPKNSDSFRYKKGRKGAVLIKVALEKAYDRLKWSFMEETLHDVGLPEGLIGVIMRLVRSDSCRLLWNGEATNAIQPSRGLRQECPLSPYLFVMYMEKLGKD